MDTIKCLDKGYVRLDKWMGTDLDPVNSAKVSFDRESSEFGDKEARLLGFLTREEHTSVFRHSALTYEMYAPLFVARQIWKYAVASSHVDDQLGWNESSRRYITEEPEFYVPKVDEWRTSPENKKQGSGEPLGHFEDEDFFQMVLDNNPEKATNFGNFWTYALNEHIAQGVELYNDAMEANIAPEMARLFLPAYGLMIRWRMTMSLGAVIHLLQQRLAHDSQYETQQYAKAIHTLTAKVFPKCMELIKD